MSARDKIAAELAARARRKPCEKLQPEREKKPRDWKKKDALRMADPAARERVLARRAVWNAIRRGELSRCACAVCGSTELVEAHHADYARPLEVMWLCKRHHDNATTKAKRKAGGQPRRRSAVQGVRG